MSARKVHLYIETDSATESSPETDGYLICGREPQDPKTTDNAARVTCLPCIRRMWKDSITITTEQMDLMREASQRSGNSITPDWGHGNGC